ncbi:hypothetical protein Syun_029637 [Stephania yunnanensis]|uniref:Uncharacterized protein n=1 Tax=Stephania yunnanensis TaxID=152371 RepID=A0AAP0E8Z2_9MAGN
MERQRPIVDFRTPQHPSAGTNNWGGCSPLLARNIPQESLEIRYSRLNSMRTRDEIFPAEDDFVNLLQPLAFKNNLPSHGMGRLPKVIWRRKVKTVCLTHNKRSRWLPRWDHRIRWPQGWC